MVLEASERTASTATGYVHRSAVEARKAGHRLDRRLGLNAVRITGRNQDGCDCQRKDGVSERSSRGDIRAAVRTAVDPSASSTVIVSPLPTPVTDSEK